MLESTTNLSLASFVGLEDVFAGRAKEEFVGEEFELVVENRLAGDKIFEHAASLSRKADVDS